MWPTSSRRCTRTRCTTTSSRGTCYPAVLIETGEEDSRVDPMHARKFAARLQAVTMWTLIAQSSCASKRKRATDRGSPFSRQADEAADVLAFVWWQLSSVDPLPTGPAARRPIADIVD